MPPGHSWALGLQFREGRRAQRDFGGRGLWGVDFEVYARVHDSHREVEARVCDFGSVAQRASVMCRVA